MTKKQTLLKMILAIKSLILLYRRLLPKNKKGIKRRIKKGIKFIVIHHTGTPRDFTSFKSINGYHKLLGYPKSSLGFFCGYQYLIVGNGKVWRARKDTETGAHTRGQNKRTIGICLTGSFDTEKPSKAQLRALRGLLNKKLRLYGLRKGRIKSHRDFRPTICPGRNLYNWIKNYD